MRVRDFKTIGGSDEISRVQDNISTVLTPVLACPLINGVLLTDISLANGATIVEHKLGRQLRGYIVVKKSADANIWDTQDSTRTITLNADAACTVTLWCF